MGIFRSFQVLCTLLGGNPPADGSPGNSKTGPGRGGEGEKPDETTAEAEHRGDMEDFGASATTDRDWVSPSSYGGSTRENSCAGSVSDVGSVDGVTDVGEKGEWEKKPEESIFNVLLGMLTIATMVDADGQATASWTTKFPDGLKLDEKEDAGREISGIN